MAAGMAMNGRSGNGAMARHSTAPSPSEGVILVDMNLRVLAYDQAAAALLNGSREVGSDGLHIPREILHAIPGLEEMPSRSPSEFVSRRVRFHNGDRVCTCHIISVRPPDQNLHGFIVLYVTRDRSLSEALVQIGLDYHLTVRELEAIEGVVMGLTSKEVAARMNISPNTVKAFLRLVMGKMGVTTRAGIVAKLLEPQANP
jgi:DNA-binding CsgD family transcriptional regulator